MGANWQHVEVKHLCEEMRDFSINNQIDVTDQAWKSHQPNFVPIHEKLKEKYQDWRWTPEQLMNKFKNVMTDYAKVKADNLQTGSIYKRISTAMIALDELVPTASPLRIKQNVDSKRGLTDSDINSNDNTQPSKRYKKFDQFEEEVLDLVKNSKTQAEPTKPVLKPLDLEITKLNMKVKLFESLKDRTPEEASQMLSLYKDFEI